MSSRAMLEVLVGWSFTACGTLLWARRPANRLGPLMALVGMLWLLGRTLTLVPVPIAYTGGLPLWDRPLAATAGSNSGATGADINGCDASTEPRLECATEHWQASPGRY